MRAPSALVGLCALSASACSSSSGVSASSSVDAGGPDTSGTMGAPDASSVEAGDAGRLAVTAFTVDTPNVVRRANIVLGTPNVAPKDSMALGNGMLGIAAWAAGGFTAQLNRADTFPDRKAVGALTIPGLAALTGAPDFQGHVDLYDATLVESGGGMTATVYVRADAPEVVVDVTGADPSSMQTVEMALWSGRTPTGAATGGVATLAETWADTSGMGASGATFGVLSGVTVGGRNVTSSVVDPLTVRVTFRPNTDGSFRVVLAAPAWSGGDAMATALSTLGSDATATTATLRAGHLAWWHDYWGRVGLVEMTSTDGTADYLEALRTNYLYLTAAESRSQFPGSQAGLADLFDFLQDTQPWFPAGFWVWNLRMQVAANMTSGAFDMNTPVFDLYQSNLASMEAWTASKMGGRAGICLPETMRFNGNGYWYGGEDNASCDQTITPSYNSLTLTSGAEIALWVWQQYLMTADRTFLTKNYPLMSEAATFLLGFATMGSDGLLHTVANAHETQWDVPDPITDIVAMRALFQATIVAASVLGTDSTLASQLQTALTKLPPMPRTDAATHMQLLTAADDAAGQDVFALSYQPSADKHNGENLDLEAVWPYGLIGDTGASTALAKRTYASRMFVGGADWSADAIDAARLGLASEVATDLTSSTETYQSFPNGLALLSGGANDGSSDPYVEQLGIVTTALNEALVQDYDGVLRIAPAWPSAWDAEGSVFVQGGSKVDVQVRSGNVVVAIVEAGSSETITVRNPWAGGSATVVDGASSTVVVPAITAATFTVPIVAGRWYAIVPSSSAPSIPNVHVTGAPATAKKTLGAASLGL